MRIATPQEESEIRNIHTEQSGSEEKVTRLADSHHTFGLVGCIIRYSKPLGGWFCNPVSRSMLVVFLGRTKAEAIETIKNKNIVFYR